MENIIDELFNNTSANEELERLKNSMPVQTVNKQFKNIKKGTIYNYLGECINCTNAQDGQKMIIYEKDGLVFCREAEEFYKKFEAYTGESIEK